jgi:transcriptional regulator
MSSNSDLVRAALEPILLEVISTGSSYGYEIAKAIQAASRGELLAQEGTLYPALHRLEKRGYLRATWKTSAEGRRRKYYTVTADGRRYLEQVRAEWESFSKVVGRILGTAHVAVAGA